MTVALHPPYAARLEPLSPQSLPSWAAERRRRLAAVAIAEACNGLSFASDPGRYTRWLFPLDDDAPARAMARSMSSCALHALAVLRALGVEHPVLSAPYRTRLGKAVSDVVAVGADLGALRQPPSDALPFAGDVVLIGHVGAPRAWCRGTVAGEHVLVVTEVDGNTLSSVDGGQPGIERRSRRIVRAGSELWLASTSAKIDPDGRPSVGRRVALWVSTGDLATTADALVPEHADLTA